MDRVTGKLTVFFEKPFGVGGFERTEAGRLSACRVTFDAEPKEYEVRAFVQYEIAAGFAITAGGTENIIQSSKQRRTKG